MEEKNELNDIILNKGGNSNGNKKVVLAVATLGIILIVVVMLMNTLTSNGTDNLPQAVLPPEPQTIETTMDEQEPLFEEVEVLDDEAQESDSLDKIAQRLKQESQEAKDLPVEPQITTVKEPETPKEVKKVVQKKIETPKPKATVKGGFYIQVGSFSRYKPNNKFLKSITDKGFTYKFHEVTEGSKVLNKVLIGPYETEKEARSALRKIRSSIEAGAFLTRI